MEEVALENEEERLEEAVVEPDNDHTAVKDKDIDNLHSNESTLEMNLNEPVLNSRTNGDDEEPINSTEVCTDDADIESSVLVNSETSDSVLLESSIVKLKVLENQNTELICENEDQKKVIEMLRIEVTKKDEELLAAENKLKTSDAKYNNFNDETTKKINDLKKAFDLANKDKESMVIKYAMGEKDIMIAKRGKDDLEKKLRESLKDKEGLQYKIKTLGTERTRLQGICDSRAQETIAARKEGEKWKEEVKVIEAKMNLTSSRLKAEVDAHRETKENLDTTFKQLVEVQGSIDDIRAECNEIMNKNKVEEENLKKKEKIQEKEHSVKLMIDSVAAAELDALKKKHKSTIEENNELSIKVQNNEKELLNNASDISELKETVAKQKTEIVDLYAKCAELESVKLQLAGETEKVGARDLEITRLRAENVEVVADMANCRRKEGELLEYTQKLTDKNVSLQSEFSSVETRAATLEEEHSRIVTNLAKAESKLATVVGQLEEETSKRREETEMLARKLAEKVRAVEVANQQVIDSNNDLEVVKRQNNVRVKELTKELNTIKKKLDSVERMSGRESSPGLSTSSRCSSSSSLHKDVERSELSPGIGSGHSPTSLTVNSSNGMGRRTSQTSLQEAVHTDNRQREVSGGSMGSNTSLQLPDTQQLLVEKIVKLQRACARRQEKLDILEEHIQQLMAEIKKKNKIIQNYFMGLETGALVSEESDIHKATVGAGHGIMASLYNSRVSDSGMTLELSLEINKKLQAVLEDTLLKNITLKENMNTLGQEISKMTMVNQRFSQ